MRRFGGRLQAREGSCTQADIAVWIEAIAEDVRYAIRGLRFPLRRDLDCSSSLGLADRRKHRDLHVS